MNQDINSGRRKQSSDDAATRRGRAVDIEQTTLRGRVEQFFGRLHERYGLARGRASAANDDISSGRPANAAALDADRLADQCMDSDYGSSPRVGMDNLAATPVADPAPGYLELIEAALGRFRRGVSGQFQQHPGVALIAAASAGFVAARWSSPLRRDP